MRSIEGMQSERCVPVVQFILVWPFEVVVLVLSGISVAAL